MRSVVARIALLVLVTAFLSGCGSHAPPGTWLLPAADLAGTRAAIGSTITARNATRLHVRWRFAFRSPRSYASTPVVDASTVFVEDLRSNVFALDRRTGKVQWAHHYDARNDGPNGLAVDGGRVYGATDTNVFALAELNGRELWSRRLATARDQVVEIAPVPWEGLLFASTIGGRGTIDALDAATGKVRWRFELAAGGGATDPMSVDGQGRLYVGTAEALVVLDAQTGRLLWRDHALAATPILAGDSVFVAGTAGRVVAWNTATHRRRWERALGGHCVGGVESPAAYAGGRLFVTAVDRCAGGSARTLAALSASTGRIVWERKLQAPDLGCAAVANDVVFTSSSGFDTRTGALRWHTRLPTGSSACPAVAGDTLYVGAGPRRGRAQLLAFSGPQ